MLYVCPFTLVFICPVLLSNFLMILRIKSKSLVSNTSFKSSKAIPKIYFVYGA